MLKTNLLWKIELAIMIILPYVVTIIFSQLNWDTSNSLEANVAILIMLFLYIVFCVTISKDMKEYKNITGMKIIAIFKVISFVAMIIAIIFLILNLAGIQYEN